VAFTTSDMMEALAIADRIIVMAAGRVTADLAAEAADQGILVRAANGVGPAHPGLSVAVAASAPS
jgi:erythritol transport system ATP-binding protein